MGSCRLIDRAPPTVGASVPVGGASVGASSTAVAAAHERGYHPAPEKPIRLARNGLQHLFTMPMTGVRPRWTPAFSIAPTPRGPARTSWWISARRQTRCVARHRSVRILDVCGRSDNAARCRSCRRAIARNCGTALARATGGTGRGAARRIGSWSPSGRGCAGATFRAIEAFSERVARPSDEKGNHPGPQGCPAIPAGA